MQEMLRNQPTGSHSVQSLSEGQQLGGNEVVGGGDLGRFIFSADSRVQFTTGIHKLKSRYSENLNATVPYLKILKTSFIPALIYLYDSKCE